MLLASGKNLTITIDDTLVRLDTSGVAIGVSNLKDWGLSGIGKFPLYLLFEADRVGIIKGSSYVWGQTIRAVSDEFTISQYGTQLSFLKNGIEIYKDDVLAGGAVAIGGIIYRAGDSVCKPDPEGPSPISASLGISGSGSADVTIPALSVIAYEGAYGIGEVTVPAPTLDASTGNHGSSNITLPALFVNSSEGFGGYALVSLPGIQATGYAGDVLSGYANNLELPSPVVFAADGVGYSQGTVTLPALTASGSGDFSVPAAQGADVSVPFFLGAGTGLTGQIGGANITLPIFDAVGADRAVYGELDKALPAFRVFGGEYPKYDGVLDGYFQGLIMSQGYGTTYPPNTLEGNIDGLEGELWGGAYLNQDMAGLEVVTMTGTVTNVGRLDGTFLPMEMNSTGLVGAYGEISGRLGEPLEGDLLGGAFLDGSIPGLVGELSATLGVVGRLDGSFPALTGELSGTVLPTGGADVILPAIQALWGILDGELPGFSGELYQTAITVQDYTAWVMNMKTGAISRYPSYAFNFLCRFKDGNYIVRSDGVYRIGGEYDIDQPIDAGFTLPSTDMGVSTQKIAPRFYLQGRMDGQFAVTTMADELDPVRSVSIIRPGVGYYRCKLPRGIRGTHLEFDVDNVSGSDFEIEQVDVLVADSGRKI
ncbi:MAG: hypothetical protein KJN61_01780 [Gammaproteobacteria bacterium]|nr:hypothetical protein [Gammaproteobacteria bacterium]